MKFVHISDLHLGQTSDPGYPWSEAHAKERYGTLARLIDFCNREQADLLLIAGNLFHRAPKKDELLEVNEQFSRLTHTKVVMIAGNCDCLTPASLLTTFDFCDKVHFLRGESIETVAFPELDCQVSGLSFHTPTITDYLLEDVKVEEKEPIRILLAHGGEPDALPIHYENLFSSGFRYYALGHLNAPVLWEDKCAAYSGSLEPIDRNDVGPRGFLLGEADKNGATVRFVPFSSRRYVALSLKLSSENSTQSICDSLRRAIAEKGERNIYKVVLNGTYRVGEIPDFAAIRAVGNIVSIRYQAVPDYDLNKLNEEHYFDVLGMYIRSFDRENLSDVDRKVLYKGLAAMMTKTGE